jgi:hypothetical protein
MAMKTFKIVLVAIFAVAMTSQAAFALTIDVTYAGSAKFNGNGVGYATGSIRPNPNSNTSLVGVGLGGDNFTTTNQTYGFSTTGSFNTWCVDITHWMREGTVTYEVLGAAELASAFVTTNGQSRVNDLQLLANDYYSKVDTQNESAAFQLATWAIMFGEMSGGNYSLNSSTFNSTSSHDIAELAQSWLSDLSSSKTTGNYSITYLTQLDGHEIPFNTQDMVVFTQTPVPEPGTMMLLGFGMLGLAIYGKRRMNKEA